MINFRIIARIFSLIIIIEGLFMLAAAGISFLYGEPPGVFIKSALITTITGIIVFSPLRHEEKTYGKREGFILLPGAFLILALFGTLPYILGGVTKGLTDAFFESMSGFTTTGVTIFKDVESLTHGILFWRSVTQWLGGMCIIFISLSVLPVAKTLNIQLINKEFTGQVIEKINPRVIQTAGRLLGIYVSVTFTEVILLIIGGMPFLDALCHSFSTMSTGGFSTKNDNLSGYSSVYIMTVVMVFMFLAGTNMAIVYLGVKRNFRKIFENNEFKVYTIVIILVTLLVGIIHNIVNGSSGEVSFLKGGFQAISMMTTTGFYTSDYNKWGNFLILILFILMFTGGTTGSTSGSIKIIRLLLIFKSNRQELKRIFHPYALLPIRLNHKPVSKTIMTNLLIFFTLYMIVICSGTIVLSFMGYDIITSMSTSAAMLGNVGPSPGSFGPFSDYSSVTVSGKWFLSGLMFIGRLELLTIMILFSKNFYKR
jgi:trk system potassium uptake protein TrkH